MKKGLKKLVIGSFILGSFSVQAGRGAMQNPTRHVPKHSDSYLLKQHGFIKEELRNPILDKAVRIALGPSYNNINGTQSHIKTMEGQMIYEIALQSVQIEFGEEWSQNGARKNARKFLEQFVKYAEEVSSWKAFETALISVGLSHPGNLIQTWVDMRKHAEAGILYEFFSNENKELLSKDVDEYLLKAGLAGPKNINSIQ